MQNNLRNPTYFPGYFLGFIAIVLSLLLAGCGGHRAHGDGPPHNDNIDASKIPDAVPRVEPFSRYGNPKHYTVRGKRYYIMKSPEGYHQRGIASWYGTLFHKQRTSSGEPYDMYKMTAAHRTLPIPCYARVTNLHNGKVVVVKINDRGPFAENRIMDLSYVAAKKLGVMSKGTALVDVEVVNARNYNPKAAHTLNIQHKYARPQIYLQVGVFSKEKNALVLKHNIEKITTYPVTLRKQQQKKTYHYRVILGPIDTAEQSDSVIRQLKSKHIIHMAMIID
jgi:rare lipoprotein A